MPIPAHLARLQNRRALASSGASGENRASATTAPSPAGAAATPSAVPPQDGLPAEVPQALRRFLRGWADAPFLPEGMRPQIPQLVEAKNPTDPPKLPADKWRGTPGERRVLVVGGGIAGMSAALELAERGYKVKIVEKKDYLGGRLHERLEKTPEGDFKVEHGLHMWFENYHVFKNIRHRLGVNHNFRPYEAVHFAFRDYKPEKLSSDPPVYPANLVNLILQSPNLSLKDAIEQFRGLSEVMYYNHDKIYAKYDGVTFKEWAEEKGISKKFYEIILEPAASVTLNDPDKVSAAEMIQFMHTYFLSQPAAMNREVTTTDHGTALIEPWADRLRSMDVDIETGRGVGGLRFEDGKAVGEVGDDTEYDHVILATSIPGTKKVLETATADSDSVDGLKALQEVTEPMKVAPPYQVLRLWLDKAPDDRPDVLETPQHPPIHLIANFSLLEDEAKEWSKKNGGAVLELHLYDSPELQGKKPEEIWKNVRGTLEEIWPEMQGANAKALTVTDEEDFTSYEVGQATLRPDSLAPERLGVPNMSFAGDWVKTDYPSALMERSVATGREAANAILLRDGVRQVDIPVNRKHGPGLI